MNGKSQTCLSERKAHLSAEHLLDGLFGVLRFRQAIAASTARRGVHPSVLIGNIDAASGIGILDSQMGEHHPEVCTTDLVAVLLPDGLQDRQNERCGKQEAVVRGRIAQAAVGSHFVRLSDVDLCGVVEGDSNGLSEQIGLSQWIAFVICTRNQGIEARENVLVCRADGSCCG